LGKLWSPDAPDGARWSLTRRGFLAGALAALGCKGRSRPTDPTGAPEPGGGGSVPGRAPSLIGYGLSDGWPQVSFDGYAGILAANGLTFTAIEHVAGAFQPVTVADVGRTTAFVNAMRRRSITTLLNIVNANNHYEIEQPDAWFLGELAGLRSRCGPALVILQGVSEPGNRGGDLDKQRRWQRFALEQWPGATATCPGFPASVDGGQYRDTHPQSRPRPLPTGNTITNTDGPWDPSAAEAEEVAKEAAQRRAAFVIYDTAEGRGWNEAIIRALGRGVAAA
jgi:hypothetical protein